MVGKGSEMVGPLMNGSLRILVSLDHLLALTSGVFFAGATVAMAQGLKNGDMDMGVLVTLYINAVVCSIAAFVLYISGGGMRLTLWGVICFAAAGILGPYLGRMALFMSVSFVGSARASSFVATEAGFTTLIAWLLLSERVGLATILGIAVIVVGLGALRFEPKMSTRTVDVHSNLGVSVESSAVGTSFERKRSQAGLVAGLSSAFMYACTNVLRKTGFIYIPSPIIGATVGVYAAALSHTCYFLAKRPFSDIVDVDRRALKGYLVAGVCLALGWWTFLVALSGTGAGVSSALKNISPLWTMILSRIVFGEKENTGYMTVVGSVLIVLGVAFIVSGG